MEGGVGGSDRKRAFRDFGMVVDDHIDFHDGLDITNDISNRTAAVPIMDLTADQQSSVSASNGILYHGGAVLSNAPSIYIVFYGNFAGSTTPQIIIDLISNFKNVKYFSVLNTYYSVAKGNYYFMNTYPKYGGVTYDSYSQGTSLTDSQIYNVVVNAIKTKKLPLNSNALYFVLTSSDVAATSGMCTKYCGWHTSAIIGTQAVRYSYVGSPMRCPSSCSRTQSVYPNANREADGMANILMHELVEAMTDADVDAWYDGTYYENADKCAWTWGQTYTTTSGAMANMKIGARDFLIQQNWINNKGGYCGLTFP
jgi:hypothetical protein